MEAQIMMIGAGLFSQRQITTLYWLDLQNHLAQVSLTFTWLELTLMVSLNKKMNSKTQTREQVIIEVMRHFGFRRNYQVAKYFNVSPQTLSGWIKAGEIPPKHLIKYTSEILQAEEKENILSKSNINHNFLGILLYGLYSIILFLNFIFFILIIA